MGSPLPVDGDGDAPSRKVEDREVLPLPRAARRSFQCTCENGHSYLVETPLDEANARRILRAAVCPICNASPFIASEET